LQPSGEAVELFDSFLTEIRKRNLLCCAVSGNHDAAERIAYGSRIMADSNINLSPLYDGQLKTVTVEDEYGGADSPDAFLKPMQVRPFYPEVEPHDYQAAIAKVLEQHPLKKTHGIFCWRINLWPVVRPHRNAANRKRSWWGVWTKSMSAYSAPLITSP
jgi:exonuclease SbcD